MNILLSDLKIYIYVINMIGGSEFDKSDFLSFAKKLKELTNKTYLVLLIEGGGENLPNVKWK